MKNISRVTITTTYIFKFKLTVGEFIKKQYPDNKVKSHKNSVRFAEGLVCCFKKDLKNFTYLCPFQYCNMDYITSQNKNKMLYFFDKEEVKTLINT